MPLQAQAVHARAQAFVEDAFQVFDRLVVGSAAFRVAGLAEKAGRRQLFGVAHHDQLPAPGNGADGVPDRNLRGFVKHHQVKRRIAGVQVLRHRQRRHQQTGLEPGQQGWHAMHQLAHRHLPALLLQLTPQAAQFAVRPSRIAGNRRNAPGQRGDDVILGQCLEAFVGFAEFTDFSRVVGA